MPTLLALNPNTSRDVTALVERVAEPVLPPGWTLRTATARFGSRYIAGEAAAAVAAHAALDALALDLSLHAAPDAVLLACFGDPGLFALKSLSPVPVLGLAEASMEATARRHGAFVVVTGGRPWVPMLTRLAASLGLGEALAGVQAVDRSGGELVADPDLAVEVLGDAAREACRRWPQARAVLLGGAGLAGLAPRLAGRVPLPVLDSVDLAASALADFAAAAPSVPAAERGPWAGLDPTLERFLAEPAAAWHGACVSPSPIPGDRLP